MTILLILICLFTGWFSMLRLGFNAEVRALEWGRTLLSPNRLTTSKQILRRAKLLTHNTDWLFFMPFFPFVAAFLACLSLCIVFGNIPPLFAFLAGVFIAAYHRDTSKDVPNTQFPNFMPGVAAKRVAQHCDIEATKAFLKALSGRTATSLKVAACVGAAELSPELALPFLAQLQSSNDKDAQNKAVSFWIRAKEAKEGTNPTSIKQLNQLVGAHQVVVKQKRAIGLLQKNDRQYKRELVGVAIEKAVYSQLAQRRAFPNLLCKNCYVRAEKKEYAIWSWTQCRHCNQVESLVLNVATVIGQIGGNTIWQHEAEVVKMSVWNNQNQTAIAADLDTLEIIGGQDINYDWAVNAVIEKLRNKGTITKPIQVIFSDSPQLDSNTLRLLKELENHS